MNRTMNAPHGELVVLTESWNRVVGIPYLVYMPETDGLLLLVSCGYPHRATILSSSDLGRNWSEPVDVCSAGEHLLRGEPEPGLAYWMGTGLTYLGNGCVMFQAGKMHAFSHDYGRTWPTWRPVPPASNGKHWYEWDPLLVDRNPASGRIVRLMSFCSDNLQSDGHFQGYTRISTDMGETWTGEQEIDRWHAVNEVAFLRTRTGRIVAACRTDSEDEHLEDIDHWNGLAVSLSDDDGNTWTQLHRLYTYGRHHPSMVQLADGRIIMTYVVRMGYPDTPDGYPQFGVEAIVGSEDGESWNLENRFVLAEWQGHLQGDKRWWPSSQSTSTVLLPDGSILTAFGAGYRSQPDPAHNGLPAPRDVGLVRWRA